MRLNEVLKYCEEHGRKISKQAIYQAGIRYGFISKPQGRTSYDLDMEKFEKWFNGGLSEAPEGWVRISELMKMYNLSLVFAYKLVNRDLVEHRKYGRGDGVTYVKLDGIERIIEENRSKKNNERSE